MKWLNRDEMIREFGAKRVIIKIKGWEKYQSYKDRRPPWIRFHRTILDDYQFQSMSAEARAMLPMFWLLACEYKDPKAGIIDSEIREIAFRLRQSVENIEHCIFELQLSDFIECIESVTKPLQECNETVTTETETETETEVIFVSPQKGKNKFSQPSQDEVHDEFISKGSNPNEAEKFFNYYSSNGWMVGKNKMKSWKHSVAMWLSRNKEPEQQKVRGI